MRSHRHTLESPFVRDQLGLRAVALNQHPDHAAGVYLLYWMQSTHRFEDNWALRLATLEADRLHCPLLIFQGLDPTYEHASDRVHSFILENARELAKRADRAGLTYRFHLRRRRNDDRRVVDRLAQLAVMVVTDAFPTAGIAERTARFAERVCRRMVAVDSHGIAPVPSFPKEEWAARARLRAFCRDALPSYEERRSDPTDPEGSSRLSPYLHFGQISAAEVARTAIAAGPPNQVEKFLDELLTWRELSLNFCWRNPRFRTLHALPPWVHETMRTHAKDSREVIYTLDQLERR